MADEQLTKEEAMAPCSCGAMKADGTPMKYGECHGKEKMCFCGSGKMAKDCCMQTPDTHAAM